MPRKPAQAPGRLSDRAWIEAAAAALIAGGIGAVRVERLAAGLGVTKGSFYWHFADRGALLKALLAHWQRAGTSAIIARLDARKPGARAKLEALFRMIGGHAYDRLEAAIRAWAQSDKRAAAVVRRADARREAYVASLLRELGLDAKSAALRARFICLAVVGEVVSGPYNRATNTAAVWQAAFRDVIGSAAGGPDRAPTS